MGLKGWAERQSAKLDEAIAKGEALSERMRANTDELKARQDADRAERKAASEADAVARKAELDDAKHALKDEMRQAWSDVQASTAEARENLGKARVKHQRASFDKLSVSGGVLRHGMLKKWPAAECSAAVESGAALQQRMTATRVVAGAVLAGPVGAIIGGMAKKKSGGEMFLVVEVPGDAIVLEVPRKKIKDAHKFAAVLNASSE